MSPTHRTLRRHWPMTTVALTAALVITACGTGDDDDAETGGTTADPTGTAATDPGQQSTEQEGAGQEGSEQDNTEDNGDDDAPMEEFASTHLSDVAGNEMGFVSFTEVEDGVQVGIEVWDLPPGFRSISIHETGLCEPQSVNELGQVGDFYSAGGYLPGDPEDIGVVEGEDELEQGTEDGAPEQGSEQSEPPVEEDWEQPPADEEAPGASGAVPGSSFSFAPIQASTAQTASSQASTLLTAPAQARPVQTIPVQTTAIQTTPEQPGAPEDEQQDATVYPDHPGNLPNLLINSDGAGSSSVVTDRLTAEMLLEDDGTAVILSSQPEHYGNIPERYAPYGLDQDSQVTGDPGFRVACGVIEAE